MKKAENLLLFLTLLFLPTQLGKHFWPDFSFVYSLPIDYLSPVIYFWDILVVLLLSFWIKDKPKVNRKALNLLLIFLLTQSISLFWASNLGAGLVRAEQYLIVGLFGVYIASVKPNIYRPLMLALLIESILATLQFFKGGTIGLWILGERSFSLATPAIAKFDFYGREFLRPYGTFPHPNVLAAFMVVVALLLSWFRKKDIIISFWAGFVVLLTVSRAAILAYFFSAFFFLSKKGKILLFLAIIILLPILYTRFSSIFNFDNISLLRREQLAEVSINMFFPSPFFGVGLNNFIPEQSSELLVGPSRFLQPVHNIFLLSLSETGIIGLLGLMLLIGLSFKRLPLIWSVIIFLGMFDHYFLTLPQGYRLLFLVWGISLSARIK